MEFNICLNYVFLTSCGVHVEVPDPLVGAESDGGEGHLPLEPGHDPAVERPAGNKSKATFYARFEPLSGSRLAGAGGALKKCIPPIQVTRGIPGEGRQEAKKASQNIKLGHSCHLIHCHISNEMD